MRIICNAMSRTRQASDYQNPNSRVEGQLEDVRWKHHALTSEKCDFSLSASDWKSPHCQ